jgi:AcrR family transcriptional regulator
MSASGTTSSATGTATKNSTTTTVSSATAARRLPRAERRAQLLQAAAAAFLRGGYDGTSMEEVAASAGVTRLIVYRIFGSKEDLYRSVLTAVVDRLGDEFAGPGKEPDSDGRVGVSARMLRVARADPDGFRLLWRHAEHEPLFAAEAQAFRVIATNFAESMLHQLGSIDDPMFRPWAATTLVAHVYEAICNWLDHGDPARDDEFATRLADGLRALVAAWT